MSPADVYLLLKSSDFVQHDLDLALVFDGCEPAYAHDATTSSSPSPSSPYELELVLRKWYPVDRARELRCFVRQEVLIGVLHLHRTLSYPERAIQVSHNEIQTTTTSGTSPRHSKRSSPQSPPFGRRTSKANGSKPKVTVRPQLFALTSKCTLMRTLTPTAPGTPSLPLFFSSVLFYPLPHTHPQYRHVRLPPHTRPHPGAHHRLQPIPLAHGPLTLHLRRAARAPPCPTPPAGAARRGLAEPPGRDAQRARAPAQHGPDRGARYEQRARRSGVYECVAG